ncbi:lysophospholipid acyltransferase family protein, partial [bacterium]|nr:lysophospholipid acyltransferase family protein [bacterium]
MGKYFQLRFAEFIARILPRPLGYGLARRLADGYLLLDRRGRHCVMSNLRRIHRHGGVELSPRALRALARENFLNFAKYLVDFFHFLQLNQTQLHQLVDFTGAREILAAARSAGQGVIVISAHLGNWELGVAALAMEGEPIHAVALEHPNPRLNELYWTQRRKRGIRVIPLGRAARECIRALRANEIVATVADRDFTPARDTVEFFGAPARLPTGPAKLALATGAPI